MEEKVKDNELCEELEDSIIDEVSTPDEGITLEDILHGDNYEMNELRSELEGFDEERIKKLFIPHYSTGFKSLDASMGGGISAGLTVIGAEPGLGKSTLALQMAESIAASGTPVLYFSMEMQAKWLAAKAISRYTFAGKRTKTNALKTEQFLSEESYEKLKDNQKKLISEAIYKISEKIGSNFYVIEKTKADFTARDISSIVTDFVEANEVKPVVFVDYLQILTPDKNLRGASDKQVVDASVNELVTLANNLKIPVVLISSVSRRGYNKESDIGFLKETGSIEYSADVILGLQFTVLGNKVEYNRDWELSREPRKMSIVFIKQRYGENGKSITFNYYSGYHYFEECKDKPRKEAKAPRR